MDRTRVERSIDAVTMTIVISSPGKMSTSTDEISSERIRRFIGRATVNHGGGQRQDSNHERFATRKRQNSDHDDDSKQRKCGLCKQTGMLVTAYLEEELPNELLVSGHTRRNCPSLNS